MTAQTIRVFKYIDELDAFLPTEEFSSISEELGLTEWHPAVWIGRFFIMKLAYYTLETVLDDGETMDIGPATPEGSSITALLFKRIASFDFQGSPANVICCIGITQEELDFCFENGSKALLEKMPPEYILTEMSRKSFV